MPENNSIKIKIISFAALVFAVGTVVYANTLGNGTTSAHVVESAPTVSIVAADPVVVPKSKYKDGTYTASGVYAVPEGSEQITVTLTIANDVVVDASVVNEASRGDSRKYQSRFSSGYKSQVVGKSIDDIKPSRISGSSLTPKGFNSALAKIKAQAVA